MGALDIGIDLGTTKTIIFKDKNKFVLNEPSLVAVDIKKDEILAIGNAAFKMFERTPPNIKVVYPLRDGVISNHELTKVLLKECLKKANSGYLVKHKVTICVPSFVTNVEKRTLIEVVSQCGAQKVYLLEEPVAAAIGSGLDISKANGNMIVDIGGGTVDIAVISMSGVVQSTSIKYAGNKIDEEIVKLFIEKYKIIIGTKMANMIKNNIANIYNPSIDVNIDVKGRSLLTGLPCLINVNQIDIYDALANFSDSIITNIKMVLEKTPPELVGDIYENGIILTGGGSLLGGLCELIAENINVRCNIPENPIECVAKGTAMAFDFINTLENGFSTESILKY